MQNIGGENAGDAFYRYKMPRLVGKIEGRGNGIKTNVVNNVDVAKALERPPEYILKFYGCELGAQTNFDKSTGTSIVNGAHDTKRLAELLEAFIKKYVQCYSCGNPETTVKVKAKDEAIFLKCKACGHVSAVDMRHKLNTFILKNPPDNKESKEERRLRKAEEERVRDAKESGRKSKKSSSKDKTDGGAEGGDGGDEEDDEGSGGDGGGKKEKKSSKKDKSKKSSSSSGKLKKSASGKTQEGGEEGNGGDGDGGGSSKQQDNDGNNKDNDDDDDDDEEDSEEVVWMTDTSAAAAAARAAEQLTAATAALVMQGNLEVEAAEARKAAKKAAKAALARAESGERLDAASAAAALRAAMSAADPDAGAPSATALPPSSKEAMAAAVKLLQGPLTVEGGAAGKARALYEALFLDVAAEGGVAGGGDEKEEEEDAATATAAAWSSSSSPAGRLAADVARFAPLLRAAARALGGAAGALAQLVALEHLLAVSAPERVREAAPALKALHDEDVLGDEALVVAWAERADAGAALGVPPEGAAAVRAAVAPVVQWLKEAETSSEGGSDDEDEDDEDEDEEDESDE